MQIKKLIYVTDMNSPRFEDVDQLMVLRKLGLEEVIFLNPSGIEDWDKRVEDYGVKARALPGEGPVLSRILDAARQEAPSMIAASLNRRHRKVLRGSLIKKLLRSSPVPVILLNQETHPSGPLEKGVFQHVIYATDWSPVSESVLKYLLNLKEIIETLEIVNVIHKKLSVRELRSLRQRITETRRIFLDEGIDAEAHIYAGKPHEEILLAATDYDATAIVMGTSCKSPMQEIIRRSCSYRVAEEAEIPVLFIGQRQKME
ncbi:MAG: universal stress protein [Desulfobacteraceae bacterium]|jgi:nucleotide-binding universal stress UspA family protein